MPIPIIPAAIGVAKIVSNLIKGGKAKDEASELEKTRPVYKENEGYQEDLDLAESELASGGLSSKAETAYNNVNNQQFSSSLSAILKGGGSVNAVGDVFGANETGRQRLALLNDERRLSQITNLMRARKAKADEEAKAFEFNKWRVWADKAKAAGMARQGAEEGVWSGLETVGASASQWWDEKNQEKMFDKYLNPSNNGSVPSSNGQTPIQMGAAYDMNTGNQLDYQSPTWNPGINPNGNQNPYNWYNG